MFGIWSLETDIIAYMSMKPRLNVIWNEIYCKRCLLCVEVCPVQVLSLERNEIEEKDGCIRCYQCERYCPDIAIEVMDEKGKG
jgi:2-oxoglutarate ferredoxin oxidoreductase subunit delta